MNVSAQARAIVYGGLQDDPDSDITYASYAAEEEEPETETEQETEPETEPETEQENEPETTEKTEEDTEEETKEEAEEETEEEIEEQQDQTDEDTDQDDQDKHQKDKQSYSEPDFAGKQALLKRQFNKDHDDHAQEDSSSDSEQPSRGDARNVQNQYRLKHIITNQKQDDNQEDYQEDYNEDTQEDNDDDYEAQGSETDNATDVKDVNDVYDVEDAGDADNTEDNEDKDTEEDNRAGSEEDENAQYDNDDEDDEDDQDDEDNNDDENNDDENNDDEDDDNQATPYQAYQQEKHHKHHKRHKRHKQPRTKQQLRAGSKARKRHKSCCKLCKRECCCNLQSQDSQDDATFADDEDIEDIDYETCLDQKCQTNMEVLQCYKFTCEIDVSTAKHILMQESVIEATIIKLHEDSLADHDTQNFHGFASQLEQHQNQQQEHQQHQDQPHQQEHQHIEEQSQQQEQQEHQEQQEQQEQPTQQTERMTLQNVEALVTQAKQKAADARQQMHTRLKHKIEALTIKQMNLNEELQATKHVTSESESHLEALRQQKLAYEAELNMHDSIINGCVQDDACQAELQEARQVLCSAIDAVKAQVSAAEKQLQTLRTSVDALNKCMQEVDLNKNVLENLLLKATRQQLLAFHSQSFQSAERCQTA